MLRRADRPFGLQLFEVLQSFGQLLRLGRGLGHVHNADRLGVVGKQVQPAFAAIRPGRAPMNGPGCPDQRAEPAQNREAEHDVDQHDRLPVTEAVG